MKLVRAKEGYRKVGDKYLLARKCTKCGKWLVANTVNFYKNKSSKYGLQSECKECRSNYHKQWREDNKEKEAEQNKQWRQANKDKKVEYDKQYYEANKEKRAEYHKQWQQANKERIAEQRKQYYQDNRDELLERQKQYHQTPQGQIVVFNSRQRRRIKEEEQGTGITKDQWLEMMSFFNWKCAYSGEYLGGNDNSFNRTIDHIVPLNSGGDNMIWNCVPMTRSLNSSKNDKDMEKWYKEQECYDPKRLAKIYEWQEYAYNKYGKDSEYFNTNDI